jgi:choline transporter-like protein 2/4/5
MARSYSSTSEDGEKEGMIAPPDFDGPTTDRKCTDILFAILILVCWVAMTGLGIYSWNNGDYRAVLYPMDYDGNICGTDFGTMDMTDYTKIIYINNFGGGVCVKECPSVENFVDVHTLVTYDGVYQEDGSFLTADFIDIADYSNATGVRTCDASTCSTDPSSSWFSDGIKEGKGYAYYAMDTVEVLQVRCLTNPTSYTELQANITTGSDSVFDLDGVNEATKIWNNLYGDIYEARLLIILFGLGAAMVIGFVYTQLLRIQLLLGVMIWGSILVSISIFFACGGYAYVTANEWRDADPQTQSDYNITAAKIFSFVLFGIGALAIVITVFLRKQIQLSMACVRAAGRAMSAMPTMIVFPFIQIFGLAGFTGVWFVYAVHLASTGSLGTMQAPTDASVTVRTYEFDDITRQCGWYLLFCFFWTAAFIAAVGEIVIAMCVAKWYFSRDKRRVGMCTIFTCIGDTMRYHLGTAAFGSLIIALTKMVRAFVTTLQKKAKALDNKVGQALLCCCQCCLWCFEKLIKFLNKNAYIQTAIFGTPFCKSAREAFHLIMRNAGKIASITYVSTLILFVGKVFISAATTGAGYVYMDYKMTDQLYSTAGPCILIFCLSYFIAGMFMSVFDMSTSTILQCFVADEEMFEGDECYAERELREFIDGFEEEEKRIVGRQ